MPIPTLTTNMTIGQALRRVTDNVPAQTALVCGPLRLTFSQLQERVDQAADWMGRLGIGKGDRVALLLPPSAEFVATFFGAAERGAIAVPLDLAARPAWLAQAVAQTGAALLVAQAPLPAGLQSALPASTAVATVQDLAKVRNLRKVLDGRDRRAGRQRAL